MKICDTKEILGIESLIELNKANIEALESIESNLNRLARKADTIRTRVVIESKFWETAEFYATPHDSDLDCDRCPFVKYCTTERRKYIEKKFNLPDCGCDYFYAWE